MLINFYPSQFLKVEWDDWGDFGNMLISLTPRGLSTLKQIKEMSHQAEDKYLLSPYPENYASDQKPAFREVNMLQKMFGSGWTVVKADKGLLPITIFIPKPLELYNKNHSITSPYWYDENAGVRLLTNSLIEKKTMRLEIGK